MLLDHNEFYIREAATKELCLRGEKEINQSGKALSWKNELIPDTYPSAEVRSRLRIILREIDIMETKLLWRGMRLPSVEGYDCDDAVAALPYLSALTVESGGLFDMENYAQHAGYSSDGVPSIFPGRSNEAFWKWIARNKGMKASYKNGCLEISPQNEDAIVLFDGALCCKLSTTPKGVSGHLMTDPGLELVGKELLSATAVIDGCTYKLEYVPSASPETYVNAEFPEEIAMQSASDITLQFRLAASPVVRASFTNFTRLQSCKLGAHTVQIGPCQRATNVFGKELHFIRCTLSIPGARGDPLPPEFHKFFTVFSTDKDGGPSVLFPKSASYDRLPLGAEFLCSFDREPTSINVRIADDRFMHTERRTINYTKR